METLKTIDPYLLALTMFLAAIYNAILAYENRGKVWKLIGSILTVVLFAVLGGFRLFKLFG
jgi:uncharacterized BrkB/YihY/UPF0761 family membrane protein